MIINNYYKKDTIFKNNFVWNNYVTQCKQINTLHSCKKILKLFTFLITMMVTRYCPKKFLFKNYFKFRIGYKEYILNFLKLI